LEEPNHIQVADARGGGSNHRETAPDD
jgi:hypothetical protein